MKNLLSVFYTRFSKIILSVVLIILALIVARTHVGYFNYYSEDPESFINAITQLDSFDFPSSYFFKNIVTNTVEGVIKLSMDYENVFEENTSAQEVVSYYNSIGDSNFAEIYQQLSSMKGFCFAVVNHDKHKIYSNIQEINGKNSNINIRKFFTQNNKTLLIARSCKNPYFATDTFIAFAEPIRDCALKYEDNFDLYISFGTEENYNEKEKYFKKLHFDMRKNLEKLNNKIIIHCAVLLFVFILLLIITGKNEPKGKTYPTIINRLPNDLIFIMYGIILICLSSLYRTACTMLLSHGNELDEFWFTHSENFYTDRIEMCLVLFVCTAANLACILKRQYKMGMLIKNTYIYDYLKNAHIIKNMSDSTQEKE